MIVSASYRTDIPAFHGDWFEAQMARGVCVVANPYGGAATRVALDRRAVDGFVFWTRNPAPFMSTLDRLRAGGWPFVVQFTIIGYPRTLDAAVPAADRQIAALRRLYDRFGPDAVVWRYDPVLITDATPPQWHRRQFEWLATSLAGMVDEVVLSFAAIYAKTRRNLDRMTAVDGVAWRDPPADEKAGLLADLAGIAAGCGLTASLCAQPDLLAATERATPPAPLGAAACIDAARLSRVTGRPIAARTKGNRHGCLCAESRDIGAYDTCPHGCVYCYANRSPAAAKRGYLRMRERIGTGTC